MKEILLLKTRPLMLYPETTSVRSKNHTEHINTV